ncbi:MAG: OmpA family protein [Saprospiraceae bacterium]|jgi:OmpA-OmpF porin, OOP family|nr:OmpA family protein [Candidatus Defluviibacterium haderslevense]MCI1266218.1 thrombospondin type 3 repeat-containing protein [Saprospiraceae bacterium]
MKHLIVIFGLLVVIQLRSDAQVTSLKQGVFARKTFIDYNTFREGDFAGFKSYRDGFEIGYIRNFGTKLSLLTPIGISVYQDSTINALKFPLFSFGGQVHYHLFKGPKWINPYVIAGIQVLLPKDKEIALQVPMGLGVNFMVHPQVYMNWQSDYRLPVINWENHFQHSVGFIYMFGNIKGQAPKIEKEIMDSDGDGITDDLDLCPSIAGLAIFSGCPDTDKDGISDLEDECPEIFGLKLFNGCPDTDEDNVPDNKDECPNLKGLVSNKGCPESDRDGDGIPDKEDHCPDKAGLTNLNGCPDSDGDGVSDKDDRCPDVPGLKAKGGCPETKKDADNDGIIDEQDECPFTAGLSQFKGCPDTDGDGVQDKLDDCPNAAGPKSNKGCPVIEKKDKEVLDFAMRAVQFDLGRSTLKEESFKILDKITIILKKYPDYNLAIGGHTDNTGSAPFNLELSEKRAKVCYEYIISKGMLANRLSYTGYGATQPIADNKTENGRFLNRRTEFNLIPR